MSKQNIYSTSRQIFIKRRNSILLVVIVSQRSNSTDDKTKPRIIKPFLNIIVI